MNKKNKSQKGQALILIAIGIIGLVGFTSLAIDGGNAFSERRRAQNAADTAAMAAALEKTNDMYLTPGGTLFIADDGDGINWYQAGINLVEENGYNLIPLSDTIDSDKVEIVNPPGLNCKGDQGPYFGLPDYIQVLIHINVNTYFAPVVGISQTHSCVEAIAYAKAPISAELYDGSSIVALAPHECKAVKYNGSADALLVGGGIYVNSDCDGTAFFNHSGSAAITAPSLQSVGAITYKPGSLNIGTITTGVAPVPYPPDYNLPAPEEDCDVQNPPAKREGNILWPGNWYGQFPPVKNAELRPGLYCVYAAPHSFSISTSESIYGEGVTIAVMTGGISMTGSKNGIYLTAPYPSEADCLGIAPLPVECKYYGLLIFMPMDNNSDVTFNGNASWEFWGTVLTPAAPIKINGTENGTDIHSQIIGYTVDLTGDGSTNITYESDKNYDGPYNPKLELTQ